MKYKLFIISLLNYVFLSQHAKKKFVYFHCMIYDRIAFKSYFPFIPTRKANIHRKIKPLLICFPFEMLKNKI